MWGRLILALCALPLVVAWMGSTPSNNGADIPNSGRRRFLKTAVVGGGVLVGAAVWNKKAMLGPAAFTPPPSSLDGQTILITGASAGLGLESAKRLAAGGATVVLTTRTASKGEKAVKAVQEYLNNINVDNKRIYSALLDLDDLQSVRAFDKQLPADIGKIDVLMNNAGVMAIPDRQLTKDGYERTFQSNHLGHFLLTNKLTGKLADDARIINVSSEAHKFASKGLELDNLNGEREYGPWSSYGQSKLANILFSKELQARAEKAGKQWTAVSLHPGAVQTDLARNLIGEEKWAKMQTEGPSLGQSILFGALSYFVIPVERGATTQVWLAAGQGGDSIGGEYVNKCKAVNLIPAAQDMDMAKELWAVSEKLTGEEFKL